MHTAHTAAATVLKAAVILGIFNFLILFAALAQIALEGTTGHWSPFWSFQAELVVRALTALQP